MQLLVIIKKELLLLRRDIHGLLLLFVMPIVFILIMSLALKADFDRRSGVQLDLVIDDRSASAPSREMLKTLAGNELFNLIAISDTLSETTDKQAINTIEQAIKNDRYSFLAVVPEQAFTEDGEGAAVVELLVAPATSIEMTQLLVASLREAAVKQKLILMLDALEEVSPDIGEIDIMAASGAEDENLISIRYGVEDKDDTKAPTSVQQNVPAWLVFSMFFVVVPLANTLINERQLGTLRRIQTIPVSAWKLIVGKMTPYFIINQIQVVLMLIVGMTLVPWLGGDRLNLGDSILGLAIMSSSLSVAALGYAMLVAVISRTTEQATTLGGAGNIILAALGGIMVPAFVMPNFMQEISVISPMSWGLQGFLDIFLRGGGVAQIWPEALSLFTLGMLALGLALFYYRQND
jgi:ABC-2 type transport system permease protein